MLVVRMKNSITTVIIHFSSAIFEAETMPQKNLETKGTKNMKIVVSKSRMFRDKINVWQFST